MKGIWATSAIHWGETERDIKTHTEAMESQTFELRSPRLVLRAAREGDAAELYKAFSDPDVMRYWYVLNRLRSLASGPVTYVAPFLCIYLMAPPAYIHILITLAHFQHTQVLAPPRQPVRDGAVGTWHDGGPMQRRDRLHRLPPEVPPASLPERRSRRCSARQYGEWGARRQTEANRRP